MHPKFHLGRASTPICQATGAARAERGLTGLWPLRLCPCEQTVRSGSPLTPLTLGG